MPFISSWCIQRACCVVKHALCCISLLMEEYHLQTCLFDRYCSLSANCQQFAVGGEKTYSNLCFQTQLMWSSTFATNPYFMIYDDKIPLEMCDVFRLKWHLIAFGSWLPVLEGISIDYHKKWVFIHVWYNSYPYIVTYIYMGCSMNAIYYCILVAHTNLLMGDFVNLLIQ